MAEFTDAERQLMEGLTRSRLCESLALIRHAVEDIWADDAPHIIQDYTDHGIHHSERLSNYAVQLMAVNDGRAFSAEERFLLLAGIYLHDVGMQCDVIVSPEIKARAETMGAKFDIDFTAKTTSSYTVDEQKVIRENHHLLTAAWIDHAFRTGETILGSAIGTVPDELVGDLIDVCKYHAKLPIARCPITFTLNERGRKQLVAALVRLCDELDVDSQRVSIETVRTFRLDPRNAVYWWLHQLTKVNIAGNVITLTTRLHPDDERLYGPVVREAFFEKFRTKNRPVMAILRQNGIPIVISADSGVVAYDYTEPLPGDVVQALQLMQPTGGKRDTLHELTDEVRTWLEAIGYEVNDRSRDDRTQDMIASLHRGLMQQQVHVRCFEGEIAFADLRALEAEPSPQKWAISQMRIAPSAREYAESCPSLNVYNLSDFMRLIWGPYFDSLVALVEESDIRRYYVDLGCHRKQVGEEGDEITRDTYPIIDEYIDNWISERGRLHISILGEFGTGKTWFCRHFAYHQLNRYLSNPIGERLPLLITLRSFSKAMTAQQLINDALLEQYRLPFAGSAFDVFQEMNRRGKLLLILDGFDEMARKVDYQTVVDNFWELARLALEASKVLLTSRVEYFRWAKESEQVLGGKELGRRMISVRPPEFEVLYLEPLSEEQIEEVIVKRMGPENGPAIAQVILGKSNLAELARRPVLIELLLSALPQIGAREKVSEAQVYLYATNELLLRNIAEERTFTSTADKLLFLCELAWTMIARGELRVHYTDIPERIQTWFGDHIRDKPELDHWDYDLRSQTLLQRNAAGYYEFAHKSLAEFFVAYKFAAELGCLAPEFSQAYREAGGQPCKMPIEEKDLISLAETFGAIPLRDPGMYAVMDFLTEMIDEGAAERLWQVIDETKGKAPESVQYVGGNAGTLLGRRQESFVNAELEHTVLTGLEIWGADLSGANLRRAVLIDARLSDPTMRNTDLRYCDLQRTELEEHGATFATWEPNDRYLLTASDSDAILWDPRNWSPIARQEFPFAEGARLAKITWNPDGSQVMAISYDGEIALWHTRTHALEIIGSFPLESAVTVSNDGAWILTSNREDVSLWSVSDDISGRLAVNGLRMEAASSLSDREGFQTLVWVREGDLWKLEVRVIQARKFGTLGGLKRSGFHTFSPGAKYLGCMSLIEGDSPPRVREVQVVRVDTQETLKEIVPTRGRPANHICFDPFEMQVAFISGACAVSVHDLASGEELVTLGDPSRTGIYIRRLAYNSAGTRIAAARFDFTTIVWDLASGQSLAVLPQRIDCCLGAQIANAIGLGQVGYGPCIDQTLEKWLVARGAVGKNQR